MPSSRTLWMAAIAVVALVPPFDDARASSPPATVDSATTFTNPVIDADFPDPELVIDDDGTVWAYATGIPGSSAIQVTSSTDLVEWKPVADALPQRPSWQPLQAGLTWAPDVVVDGTDWRMYYVARDAASGHQCLSVAVASTPGGPFEDDSSGPFLCQHELGGSIDPHVFVDDDGTDYLFWKNDGNAIGVDTRIWVQELAPDGVTLVAQPVDTGLHQTRPWQGDIVEAPSVVRIGDDYVMFYSANGYWSADYAIGYATASSVTGPYVDQSSSAWASSLGDAAGPGGETTIEIDGELWMAYHAWSPAAVGYDAGGQRTMWLDRIVVRDDVIELDGPTDEPQPSPIADPDG